MADFPLRFKYRPKTQDEMCIREVFMDNCYHLPTMFEPDDVILDIGAHIGSFTLACLERGARHIIAFEPSPENYGYLVENLKNGGPRWNSKVGAESAHVALHQRAVVGGTGVNCRLRFYYPGDVASACGHVVSDRDEHTPTSYWVDSISFDDIVNAACMDIDHVRFCKIDAEGAEQSMLLGTKVLPKIIEIAMEYHGDILEPMKLLLEDAGFDEIAFEQIGRDYPLTQQGLLFGRRTELLYGKVPEEKETSHGADGVSA